MTEALSPGTATWLGTLGLAAASVALLVALDAAGAAIAAVASLVAVALMASLAPTVAVALLLVWIAIQNLVAPILLTIAGLGVDDVRGIIGTKELMAVCLLTVSGTAAAIAGRVKLLPCDKLWLGYAAFVLLYALNPFALRAEPFYLAVSIRALLVPVLFYSLGRIIALEDSDRTLRALTTAVLGVAVSASLFGLMEVLVLGDGFWKALDIKRYWVEVKGFSPRTIVNDLPANFYGQYGIVEEMGRGIRRMASVYGDPLSAGYNLFFAALLCFAGLRYGAYHLRTVHALGFALLTAALALTVSRAALAALALGCGLLVLRERGGLGARGAIILGIVGLGLLVLFRHALAPAFVSAITMEDPSTRSHLLDLARGLQHLASPRALLGFGLGTAGAPAAASGVHIGITESAYLVMLAQIGLAGVVLFVSALTATYLFLVRSLRADGSEMPPAVPALAAGLVGYALTGLISEQIFTTTSLAVFWTLLGAGVTRCAQQAPPAFQATG